LAAAGGCGQLVELGRGCFGELSLELADADAAQGGEYPPLEGVAPFEGGGDLRAVAGS
jgi:hypothetical protein